MKMNKDNLFLSFNHLDPDLIEEAQNYKGPNVKKKKFNKWKNTIISMAAAAAVFILIPNISPVAAHAMGNIPFIGAMVKAVTFRNYEDEYQNSNIVLDVPHVEIEEKENASVEKSGISQTGVENDANKTNHTLTDDSAVSEAVEAINLDIDKVAEELMNEYQESLKEEDPHLSLYMSYETIATTEQYFTLKLNCFKAAGSGYEWNKFYTIDCHTGKQLSLKDLFVDDADYVSAISTDLISQMKAKMAEDENLIYFVDSDMPEYDFKQIKEDQNFYINADQKLVIAFDEAEVAPGYMGAMEFVVNDEAINAILRK